MTVSRIRRGFITAMALALIGILALAAAAYAQSADNGQLEAGALRDWLGFIALITSVGGVIYTWITAGSAANAKSLETHEHRLADHGERLTKVENEIAHLPPKDDVTELKLAISDLKGTIGKLDAHLSGISRSVVRMDDYLRKDDK